MENISFKEKWKEFKIDVKKFIWYIVFLPNFAIKSFFKSNFQKSVIFLKTYTWLWVFLTLFIIFIIFNESKLKWIALIFFIILLIKYEWERGYFRKKWREEYLKKIKEQYGDSSAAGQMDKGVGRG